MRTIVRHVPNPELHLRAFKQQFFCNGTILPEDGQIQLQGDQRANLVLYLGAHFPDVLVDIL